MNKEIIKGNWKILKGKIKEQWGELTDDEITRMNGSYEELEGNLLKKYGWEKDQAKKEIQSFLNRNNLAS